MPYQLKLNNLGGGASQQVIPLLAAFQKFAALPAPVTAEAMRVAMELDQLTPAGQARTYTDLEWLAFLTSLASIGFTEGLLTTAELTVYNTIRSTVNPPKSLTCCGNVTPSQGDGLTDLKGFSQLGFPNFRHEIRLIMNKSLTCDIKSVQLALTPIGAAPTITDPLNLLLFFDRCDTETSSAFYSKQKVEFSGDPSGFSYEIFYSFFDANGASVTATYQAAYILNIT